MRRARGKLHSSSGASLLLALLFLLFSTMVGAVILTAASANVGRVSQDRDRQQGYLAVSSAARLLRGELEGLTFTGTESTEESAPSYTFSSAGALPLLVDEKARQVFELDTAFLTPSLETPEVTQLTVAPDDAAYEALTAELSMDADDYTVTVTFPGTAAGTYPLTLVLPAQVSDITTSSVISYTDIEEVDGVATEITHYRTVSTRTVTVSWDTGLISKGD